MIPPSAPPRPGATRRNALLAVCAALLLAGACAKEPPKQAGRDSLTQRQRDSAIGASQLPGAQGVQKALKASDSATARANALDTIRP